MDEVISRVLHAPNRRRRRLLRNPAIRLCLLTALVVNDISSAAESQPLEYEVKAAFLLNFIKFIDWPATAFASADSPIGICVFGHNPFDNVLNEMVDGEVVNGRRLAVASMKLPPAPKSCQVAFISMAEEDVHKVLPGLGHGVLSVGEGEHFVREGGIITFVIENRRVRFDINRSAAASAGLKLSSKLLSLARLVEK